MKNRSRVVLSILTVLLNSCGDVTPSETMNAEFSNLASCLDGIRRNSGMTLRIITDKPDNVSGFLSNNEGFGCTRRESGTKGVYYDGWYIIKK